MKLNKIFIYHGNSFNFCVKLNAGNSEEKPHTLVVNDMGHTNYIQTYYFNNKDMFDIIKLGEREAAEWTDNRSGKTEQEWALIDLGFK